MTGAICDGRPCFQQSLTCRRRRSVGKKGTRSATRLDARRRRVVIGDDEPSVTAREGLSLVSEAERVLGVAEVIGSALGWLKARRRGLGGRRGAGVHGRVDPRSRRFHVRLGSPASRSGPRRACMRDSPSWAGVRDSYPRSAQRRQLGRGAWNNSALGHHLFAVCTPQPAVVTSCRSPVTIACERQVSWSLFSGL